MIILFLTLALTLVAHAADAQVECDNKAPVWQVCTASHGKPLFTSTHNVPGPPTPPSDGDKDGPGNSDGGHDHGKGHDHDGKGKSK